MRCCLGELHISVSRIIRDVTGVLPISKTDIARLAPRSSPGVSDLPVATGVDTDGLYTVVNIFRTGRHDATLVRVPGGCIQTHGERSSGLDIVSHVGLTTDGVVPGDGGHVLGRRGLASASDTLVRGVWIVTVEFDTTSRLDVVF